MIISNKNKRRKGRPSFRTMTVRKGYEHATIVFSQKAGVDLNMIKGNKVNIICVKGCFYICTDSKSGVSIKIAKNGRGVENYRISCLQFVTMLLNGYKANNLCSIMIGATTKKINGEIYYMLIKKPFKTDTNYF